MQLVASFICDDIRLEQGNKLSLMGLYDEKFLIASLPARIAKLCIFQRWSEVPIGAKLVVEFRGAAIPQPVRAEGRIVKGGPSVAGQSFTNANLSIVFAPVDLVGEGELEFLTYWEDRNAPDYRHRIQVGLAPKQTEDEQKRNYLSKKAE